MADEPRRTARVLQADCGQPHDLQRSASSHPVQPGDVIRATADTGDCVGVCCIPSLLRRTGDIVAFLEHIDYAITTFGAYLVAVGTDVACRSGCSSAEARKVPTRGPSREWSAAPWPKDSRIAETVPNPFLDMDRFRDVESDVRGMTVQIVHKCQGGSALQNTRSVLHAHHDGTHHALVTSLGATQANTTVGSHSP